MCPQIFYLVSRFFNMVFQQLLQIIAGVVGPQCDLHAQDCIASQKKGRPEGRPTRSDSTSYCTVIVNVFVADLVPTELKELNVILRVPLTPSVKCTSK